MGGLAFLRQKGVVAGGGIPQRRYRLGLALEGFQLGKSGEPALTQKAPEIRPPASRHKGGLFPIGDLTQPLAQIPLNGQLRLYQRVFRGVVLPAGGQEVLQSVQIFPRQPPRRLFVLLPKYLQQPDTARKDGGGSFV